jgi:hypothetical protein
VIEAQSKAHPSGCVFFSPCAREIFCLEGDWKTKAKRIVSQNNPNCLKTLSAVDENAVLIKLC